MLFDWLLDGAPGAASAEDIARRLGDDLLADGVPLARVGVFVTSLHPNVLGRAFRWEAGAGVRVADLTPEARASREFSDSPVAAVIEHGAEIRWRRGDPDRGWEVLASLAKDGFADYLALPLRFMDGETHVVTFASRTSLADEHVAALRRVARPLARVAEISALRRTARSILTTYVGTHAGPRVLAGKIRRGDVETIRAAIWFSDLRGFTELTQRAPAREVVAVLNDVFAAQVPAVEKRGGEVLKFMGDGMLAIFPAERAADALDAAEEAVAALAGRHRIGVALHVGDIEYGNIGAPSRLDFTAIGPAVNVAARLEGVAGKTGRAIVASAAFATATGRAFEELGVFELKGIAEPQRVLAPAR